MIIDFEKVDEVVHQNFFKGEKETVMRAFVSEGNKILRGKLAPGASIGVHTHEINCEIFYIISGKGTVLYNGEYEDVCEGQAHYCPKGHSHSLINNSDADLIFFGVVAAQ